MGEPRVEQNYTNANNIAGLLVRARDSQHATASDGDSRRRIVGASLRS